MGETKYEREKRQIAEAMAQFPKLFRLRAFPEATMRLAGLYSHFVLHGEVQIVVQIQGADGNWQDMGRDSAANVKREIVEVIEQ